MITERNLRIIKELKKGKHPKTIIDDLVATEGISKRTAQNNVYAISGELKKTTTELLQDAKDYILLTLMGVIERTDDDKIRLQAIKQLSDVCKITDNTVKIDAVEIVFK